MLPELCVEDVQLLYITFPCKIILCFFGKSFARVRARVLCYRVIGSSPFICSPFLTNVNNVCIFNGLKVANK